MSAPRFFKIAWALVWGVVLTHGQMAWSQEENSPVSVLAERMVARNIDRVIVFEGNVVLTKGEFTLTADRLEVTLPPERATADAVAQKGGVTGQISSSHNSVARLEATGHVQVNQGNRHGRANHAIYDQEEEKVILTGEPEVWERDYRVSGKKMIFFLREQKSVVEDSKAIVYPR